MDAAPDLRQNAWMQNLLRLSISRGLGIAFESLGVLGSGFAVLRAITPLYSLPDAQASTSAPRMMPIGTRLKIDSVSTVSGRQLYRVRMLRGKGPSPATWAYDTGSLTRGYAYLTAADLRH